MRSTLSSTAAPYIGADLTDRYSQECRDIDVCGLTPAGNNQLSASFWCWQWDRAPQKLDVAPIANELRDVRVAMLDGPQALADKDKTVRSCERQSAAVGKTPDCRPNLSKPFAGFICSSLDLFNELHAQGVLISPAAMTDGVFEVYPGHIWTILRCAGTSLPKKGTKEGRTARRLILEALGVIGLPDMPTHDQNDACIAAVLAAAADNQIPDIDVLCIGAELFVDSGGVMREGPMIIPQLAPAAVERIAQVLSNSTYSKPAPVSVHDRTRVHDLTSHPHPKNAEDLLSHFVAKAIEGDPEVCTYARAYSDLIQENFGKFSQAYAQRVIALASETQPRELPGLGPIRLDAFIVSKANRRPSHGHWTNANYDREEWERALGNARLLC